MKSPNWAYAVGIIMILVGSCSVNKHIQALKTPELVEVKNDILDGVSIEVDKINIDSLTDDMVTHEEVEEFENVMESIENIGANAMDMLHVSEYAQKWMVRLGYVGIFFAIIYILGGLMLLIPKSASLQVAYIGLGLAVLFSIAHWIIMAMDPEPGLMSQSSGWLTLFGIVIDGILFLVIFVSDKTAFNQAQAQ